MKGIRGVVGFVRTVEAGSFAGAAKKLGISPVAVGKNVQRLERQLGVRLLQRSTRKLSLTEEGRLYYERCTGPLRDLESAQSAIAEKGRSPSGTLRVTSLSPFGRAYVLPLIPAFSRLYPAIELELHLDDAVSDMIAGGYDVGIRAGEARDGSMVMREVAPLNFVVCGAPSYLAERGVPSTPADLARHNCLRLRGRGPAARVAQLVAWSEEARSLTRHHGKLSGTRHHNARCRGGAGSGLGLRASSSGAPVVSNRCAAAGIAGMRFATCAHLHPLPEPQAASRRA